MLQIQVHLDESGTDSAELTIAGYIFDVSRIDAFCAEWNKAISAYNLPYFHMVDCAHLAPPFDTMDRRATIRLQMTLMRIIKRYAVNGIVCNAPNVPDNSGSTYLKIVQGAINCVVDWAHQTAYGGRIAYFFESGARGQGLVNNWFNEIACDSESEPDMLYAGHAFVPKAGNPGVQAADLLAWQYQNFTKKRLENSLPRLDLRALLRFPHNIFDFCGTPPRESRNQTLAESQNRIETVYYLPKLRKNILKGRVVLRLSNDCVSFLSPKNNFIMACPNCFRAIAEVPTSKIINNVVLKCWCGTYCDARGYAIPEYLKNEE